MAPSKHADEGGQLQLIDADRVEDEEECFESIDKRTSRPPPTPSRLASRRILLVRAVVPRARLPILPACHPDRCCTAVASATGGSFPPSHVSLLGSPISVRVGVASKWCSWDLFVFVGCMRVVGVLRPIWFPQNFQCFGNKLVLHRGVSSWGSSFPHVCSKSCG
jgi:hypothetical protein